MPPKKTETTPGLTEMIEKAVQAAVDVLSEELRNYFDCKFEKLSDSQEALQAENENLKTTVESLKGTVNSLKAQVDQQNVRLDNQNKQINDNIKWSNKNEQYTRFLLLVKL